MSNLLETAGTDAAGNDQPALTQPALTQPALTQSAYLALETDGIDANDNDIAGNGTADKMLSQLVLTVEQNVIAS